MLAAVGSYRELRQELCDKIVSTAIVEMPAMNASAAAAGVEPEHRGNVFGKATRTCRSPGR
jgi:hypothetical protein